MNSFVRFSSCTAIAVLTAFSMPCLQADILGFQGIYAPGNWTNAPGTGSIDTTGAPTSIELTSGDSGVNSSYTFFSILLPYSGTLSFHWSYVTSDTAGSTFDPFGYFLSGPFLPPEFPDDLHQLSTDGLFAPQAGNVIPFPLPVIAGQTFGFYMYTEDNLGGAAKTTITLFSAPGPAVNAVPEPATASLLGIAVLTGAFWQFFKRRRPAATA